MPRTFSRAAAFAKGRPCRTGASILPALGCLFLAALLAAPPALAAGASASGGNAMNRIQTMEKNRQEWTGAASATLAATDPELAAIRDRLIYGEIVNSGSLDAKRQALIVLAALTASQALGALDGQVTAAMRMGASPAEIRETLYQCAPYVGLPRVEAALAQFNALLAGNGIALPLENQGTVSEETRLADGLAVQKRIFGADHIDAMRQNAPEGQKPLLANYLSAYCFGDFYTRKVLDLKMRELVTFSAIVALGGCDPQAKAHAAANASVGNSKQNLVDALATMLPYIGFPRTLNGLACVNAALPEPAARK